MDDMHAKVLAMFRVGFDARVGHRLSPDLAKLAFSVVQQQLDPAIAAILAEVVAEMDEQTRLKFASFVLADLNDKYDRLLSGPPDAADRRFPMHIDDTPDPEP